MTELGLRERKKQQTRRRILDAALRLFTERGFDRVPVSAVAREAEVSEATVFNYFPTKEDLVYDGMDDFEGALLTAIRERPAGESVLSTFRDVVVRPHSLDKHPAAVERIATIARVVADSPALQARERQVFDRYTRALAELVADEIGARPDDVEPWVVANAVMGVNRALKEAVHSRALAGQSGRRIARDVLDQGRRALDVLEGGLAGYGTRADGS
jgi:AcrR family transcriptional regulator